MQIEEVASELYGLPPEDFTAARNARAKEAAGSGDPALSVAVRVLRRPTVAAWLLNQLVRGHRGGVEQVLELGTRLRAAQGTLDAAALRALDEQRRTLTRAVTQQAVGIGRDAGRKISAQVVAEVEETLRSAMVDPDAGAALATGLLTDTFSSTGLEPVALARVVALGAPTLAPARSDTARAPSVKGPADAERAERDLSAAGGRWPRRRMPWRWLARRLSSTVAEQLRIGCGARSWSRSSLGRVAGSRSSRRGSSPPPRKRASRGVHSSPRLVTSGRP